MHVGAAGYLASSIHYHLLTFKNKHFGSYQHETKQGHGCLCSYY